MFCPMKSAIVLLAFFPFLLTTAHKKPLTCSPLNPTNITTQCKKLITLGAEFSWNVHNATHIDILFTIPISANNRAMWIAWGINPGRKRPQMIGTRAIIGVSERNGTLKVSRYNITSDTKLGCRLQPLQPSENFEDVVFQNMKGEIDPNRYMSVFATLILVPDSAAYNINRLNHVWQVGYVADDVLLEPMKHPTALQNLDSTEVIDLKKGKGMSIGHKRHHLRTVHGILNMVGWGTLLPFGVIIARYCRIYPFSFHSWFFCHISCQIVGYILGTAGWAVGIWLGNASKEYHFRTHNTLAMIIFAFTTLQMIALRLKPKQTDEYRKYWDMYHHFLGYALLAVIAVNIFNGIAILEPNHKTWRWAYIGILGVLAVLAVGLEIYTWCKFISTKKGNSTELGTTQDST